MRNQTRSPRLSTILQSAILLAVSVLLNGCGLFGSQEGGIKSGEDLLAPAAEPPTTLAGYYARHADLPRRADLIACAAGGQRDLTDGQVAPVSIFFYPRNGARDVRVFESRASLTDTLDFAGFQERRWPIEPVFNGYLRRFLTGYLTKGTWLVVTYLKDDTLHTSGMIHLKVATQPTTLDTAGISLAQIAKELRFRWPGESADVSERSGQDDSAAEKRPQDAIYFEVVSDKSGNLISGTYTREPHFTFYDTENVVINIRDISPPPSLEFGQKYDFTVMAVSHDNWVNRILRREFLAQ